MHSVGFEPTIPVSELSQTYTLDRSVAGIGELLSYIKVNYRRTYTLF
jgi:hypothetical protein